MKSFERELNEMESEKTMVDVSERRRSHFTGRAAASSWWGGAGDGAEGSSNQNLTAGILLG